MILSLSEILLHFFFLGGFPQLSNKLAFSASWWGMNRAGLFKNMPKHIYIIEHVNMEHVFNKEQQRRQIYN